MTTITRKVHDIADADRDVLARVLGHPLDRDAKIVVQIQPAVDRPVPVLPEWCEALAGMTDEEVAAFEEAMSHRLEFTHRQFE